MAFTFKFFTEVLFLSIILCLANTGIVNVLVSTLYSKPDEVTGYECGLYSTKGGRLKDRISFYTVGLTMFTAGNSIFHIRSYSTCDYSSKVSLFSTWCSPMCTTMVTF